MKRFAKILSVAVLMVGIGLAAANEQVKEIPAKTSPALTAPNLAAMLDGMGLSPKEGKYTNGNSYYDVKMLHDGWDFHVRLALSPNGQVVWLEQFLGELPAEDQIPAERLINLLKKNAHQTGKAQFCIRGKNLMMMQPVNNHHLTPSLLLRELQYLCGAAKSLEPDYNPKNWTPGIAQK